MLRAWVKATGNQGEAMKKGKASELFDSKDGAGLVPDGDTSKLQPSSGQALQAPVRCQHLHGALGAMIAMSNEGGTPCPRRSNRTRTRVTRIKNERIREI